MKMREIATTGLQKPGLTRSEYFELPDLTRATAGYAKTDPCTFTRLV